jgi:hypothetical protein
MALDRATQTNWILLALFAGMLGLTVASCAITRSGAWARAQNAFNAGDYHGAIERADEVLSYGTPSEEDRANAGLLKAKSYEHLGQMGDAVGLYTCVAKTFPQTPQGYQAAAALVRLSQVKNAKGWTAFSRQRAMKILPSAETARGSQRPIARFYFGSRTRRKPVWRSLGLAYPNVAAASSMRRRSS